MVSSFAVAKFIKESNALTNKELDNKMMDWSLGEGVFFTDQEQAAVFAYWDSRKAS